MDESAYMNSTKLNVKDKLNVHEHFFPYSNVSPTCTRKYSCGGVYLVDTVHSILFTCNDQ